MLGCTVHHTPVGGPTWWRGVLAEVTSGERHNVSSIEALVTGLAQYGVYLPHDKPADAICGRCRQAARIARERD
ncbi:MAG: hypothetical protein EA356_12890 [Geminicoccaceae bacterium]|nr:MAG: hypothetical protein EA356_12890 [Geminicoccaceae bacterium]